LLPNPLRPLARSGITVDEYYGMHALGGVFPLTAGLLLYGWRAGWTIAVVLLSAAAGVVAWRRVGTLGHQLRMPHAMWLASLLAMMLPAHLVTFSPITGNYGDPAWPILPAGALILVMLLWMLGGIGAGRAQPVLIAYLLLGMLFSGQLSPHCVLQRDRLVTGDVRNCAPSPAVTVSPEPWVRRTPVPGYDALPAPSAAERLIAYTRGNERPERGVLRLQGLLSERLPPLEDFVVGGQPGAIGTSSAVAVIIGGLFLLYRGIIDHRVPMLIVVSAYVAMLVLPVPARIIEDRAHFRWFVVREGDVDWATALTFVHYEIVASPLLFTALFLATDPSVRPMTRGGRTTYAIIAGGLTAPALLYVSVSVGPYLATFAASLLTPVLDRWFQPDPLV
jgi:Na+-translocating ferredoxin:NAD+ oxidoreductase RnfD subunit